MPCWLKGARETLGAAPLFEQSLGSISCSPASMLGDSSSIHIARYNNIVPVMLAQQKMSFRGKNEGFLSDRVSFLLGVLNLARTLPRTSVSG